MKILTSLPSKEPKPALRLPLVRVLKALYNAKGPLSRTRISAKIGNRTNVLTCRAVGYSDPEKRAAFEQTRDGGGSSGNPSPSLLTLGYVRERELDIDGVIEDVVELTAAGRRAYEALGNIKLPPLRK